MAVKEPLNQYHNADGIVRSTERVYPDVDAGGNCRVPWCSYMSDNPDSGHINLDRAMNEEGRFNLFKQWERLVNQAAHMDEVLRVEYGDEVREVVDAHLMSVHDRTLMVLRLLKDRNDKDRQRLAELQDDKLCRHEGDDAEPMCNLKRHEGDTMKPEARRERTLNELHTLLHNMLFSGVDVAVKDLNEYLGRYVSAIDALVRTSMQLEGFTEECCIGCEEHGVKNNDPKYDRDKPAPKRKRRMRMQQL